MKEQLKEIRIIYMVSSAVFSAASVALEWMAPIGAALGLAVNLTEDKKGTCKEELKEAVEEALLRTKEAFKCSDSKIEIINELMQREIDINNLGELIKKTETYQVKYCSDKDAKEIISRFEFFFTEEVAKRPVISNIYILTNGRITLEKLKQIYDIIVKDSKKLDEIKEDVSGISKMIVDAKELFIDLINSVTFIMIAMAVFLAMSILTKASYETGVILIVAICYGVSDFLVFSLKKRQDTFIPLIKKFEKFDKVVYISLIKCLLPIIITVSCFLIVYFATDLKNINLPCTLFGLAMGNVISIVLQIMIYRNKSKNDIFEQ